MSFSSRGASAPLVELFSMLPDDTTPDARRFYYARLAEMSPAERISIAMQLTAAADQLTRAAVRRRFPDAEGEEFDYQVLRLRYGRALADKVYGR